MYQELQDKLMDRLKKPMSADFSRFYEAWANSMTGAILNSMDWHGLEVKHTSRTDEARRRAKSVQAEANELIRNISVETSKAMIDRMATSLSERLGALIEAETEFDATKVYIVTPFEAYSDYTMLKRQRLGVYGWMEVYFE